MAALIHTCSSSASIRARSGTTKKLCDKDFAKGSGELSGAICLKTLVLLGNDRQPPRIVQKIFRVVRAIVWLCESFLAPDSKHKPRQGKSKMAPQPQAIPSEN